MNETQCAFAYGDREAVLVKQAVCLVLQHLRCSIDFAYTPDPSRFPPRTYFDALAGFVEAFLCDQLPLPQLVSEAHARRDWARFAPDARATTVLYATRYALKPAGRMLHLHDFAKRVVTHADFRV